MNVYTKTLEMTAKVSDLKFYWKKKVKTIDFHLWLWWWRCFDTFYCIRTILQLKCLIRSKKSVFVTSFCFFFTQNTMLHLLWLFISSFLPPPRYFLVLSIRVSFIFLHLLLILIPASTLPSYFLSKNFLSSGLVLKDFSRENLIQLLLQTHDRKGTFESRAWCWGSE